MRGKEILRVRLAERRAEQRDRAGGSNEKDVPEEVIFEAIQ
jgi:hypothetical protein